VRMAVTFFRVLREVCLNRPGSDGVLMEPPAFPGRFTPPQQKRLPCYTAPRQGNGLRDRRHARKTSFEV
jgi:hypothetical protein